MNSAYSIVLLGVNHILFPLDCTIRYERIGAESAIQMGILSQPERKNQSGKSLHP